MYKKLSILHKVIFAKKVIKRLHTRVLCLLTLKPYRLVHLPSNGLDEKTLNICSYFIDAL